ncbi:LuxR C-terminal-related transcriptional regulator [Truepera radiovictrix]|uniref:Transcriptional regulator, LuxR family n=1 Tax=Truepera radiovictrix (strain DSM 17093 / CIP 108686 / LMG 22925 / RQ-24) TaxID=649638 RepID=D7CTX8_TRURR|nr:LuxR C-terminal-related transcriptional regulator [Truepera radiovictrix]ADI15675.1 transcriptional regulator, LuxR family [Truepera radiovictrix DSM 17093]WMT58697.1 LuxR C-terminal-related transcriptional regulator [Truepera radiovictrix]
MLTPPTDWALLSNRLLLLQELMVGLSKLRVEEVLRRAAAGVGWVFDGAALRVFEVGELEPAPLVSRGRVVLPGDGEAYVALFAGPPAPCYLALTGLALGEPREFRLAALFCEHLIAALEAAGYREALERQAHTDWLTGLPNQRSFEELARAPQGALLSEVGALGVLECCHDASGARGDLLLRRFAEALARALPAGARAFRTGTFQITVLLSAAAPSWDALEAALRRDALGIKSGWAHPGAGDDLAALVARASAALEAAPPAPPATPPVVRCGFGALQTLYTSWVRPLPAPASLVIDVPHGYAFDLLSGEGAPARPVLVLTEGASEPYLRDLAALSPEGLIAGRVTEAEVRVALERVAAGERFYQGPTLGDDGLFPREREVWRLVARGLSNAQIAGALGVREKTVANYVTSLQEKLHLSSRVALALRYLGRLEALEPP